MNNDLFQRVLIQLQPELAQEFGKAVIEDTKKLYTFEIIKNAGFSLEFDESQNEWSLYISNEEQCILIAKGTGIKTYDLLKEALK